MPVTRSWHVTTKKEKETYILLYDGWNLLHIFSPHSLRASVSCSNVYKLLLETFPLPPGIWWISRIYQKVHNMLSPQRDRSTDNRQRSRRIVEEKVSATNISDTLAVREQDWQCCGTTTSGTPSAAHFNLNTSCWFHRADSESLISTRSSHVNDAKRLVWCVQQPDKASDSQRDATGEAGESTCEYT